MNINYIKKIAIECIENNRIESDFLEYKKSADQKDKILKTICAFANNLMNRELNLILLGIEEHSEVNLKASPIRPIIGFNENEIEGIENSILKLTPLIKPNPHIDITHAYIDNRAFIVIAISNNNNGPYEVSEKAEKEVGLKRGRYVRIERESKLATVFQEFNLLKKFANYHFTEEFSNIATLDDLDVDYIREYLALTSNRNNTRNLSKYDIAKNMRLIDPTNHLIRNYSILMFSRNPEKYIPYSFIELIYRSSLGESVMQSKEYRGPIWKQLKNVMDDIKNNYINSLTLRVKDQLESETIYNYPYFAIEELVTNAVVHKNYENPRTVQIYIYDNSMVITNYNRPIPPITIKDLNELESFPNRTYENPTIREMFKSLDYIESYGSGIGKAKKAMSKNGIEKFNFQEYDENVDITSVTIPINSRYLKYKNLDIERSKKNTKVQNLDIQRPNMDSKDQNLDIQRPNMDSKDQNLDIQRPNMNTKVQNLDIGIKIKINTIDILDVIDESSYSNLIKKTLLNIHDQFFNDIFSRSDIVKRLNISKSSAANYIEYLQNLNVIEKVKGLGKGKYKFK